MTRGADRPRREAEKARGPRAKSQAQIAAHDAAQCAGAGDGEQPVPFVAMPMAPANKFRFVERPALIKFDLIGEPLMPPLGLDSRTHARRYA